jgi:branched-chain amino acid transport system ATP-binding protein
VLLEARGIGKRFGGVQALKDVSLTIRRGEIYGLIGPNGAGKTTLFNVLTGLYPRDGGESCSTAAPLRLESPHTVAAAGIARTFQNIRLFGNMTALENVMVGRHVRTRAGVFGASCAPAPSARGSRHPPRADELLHYVGIADRADDLARNLSYGDQRRLEIARALATEPQAAGAGRTGRRHERHRNRRLRQLIEACARRPHRAADRARRQAGDGPVRPRRRARLRREDRRGRARRGAAQPEGDRGLSWHERLH